MVTLNSVILSKPFRAVRNCIRISKYTILYGGKTDYYDRYKIADSDGKVCYSHNYRKFFKELQAYLKDKNLDKRIIDILNIY